MATRDKSKPAARTTCQGCQASWTALGAAHCPTSGCHRTFADTRLFDAHRVSGRCVDPATVLTSGRTRNPGQIIMQFRDGMWRSPEVRRNCANTEGALETRTEEVHNRRHCSVVPKDNGESPRAARAGSNTHRGGIPEMAQQTEVKLLDDKIRHEEHRDVEADVTTEFALDGKSYEIDLTKENDGALRDALAPFIAAARRIAGGARTRSTTTTSHDRLNREESQEIRKWARSRNMEVSERGRIPRPVREAYRQMLENQA